MFSTKTLQTALNQVKVTPGRSDAAFKVSVAVHFCFKCQCECDIVFVFRGRYNQENRQNQFIFSGKEKKLSL